MSRFSRGVETVFTLYQEHTADLCPWDHDDLVDALRLTGGDITSETLEAAFDEVGIRLFGFDDVEAFLDDVASALSEDQMMAA